MLHISIKNLLDELHERTLAGEINWQLSESENACCEFDAGPYKILIRLGEDALQVIDTKGHVIEFAQRSQLKMAPRGGGSNYAEIVDQMYRRGSGAEYAIKEILAKLDQKHFLPASGTSVEALVGGLQTRNTTSETMSDEKLDQIISDFSDSLPKSVVSAVEDAEKAEKHETPSAATESDFGIENDVDKTDQPLIETDDEGVDDLSLGFAAAPWDDVPGEDHADDISDASPTNLSAQESDGRDFELASEIPEWGRWSFNFVKKHDGSDASEDHAPTSLEQPTAQTLKDSPVVDAVASPNWSKWTFQPQKLPSDVSQALTEDSEIGADIAAMDKEAAPAHESMAIQFDATTDDQTRFAGRTAYVQMLLQRQAQNQKSELSEPSTLSETAGAAENNLEEKSLEEALFADKQTDASDSDVDLSEVENSSASLAINVVPHFLELKHPSGAIRKLYSYNPWVKRD